MTFLVIMGCSKDELIDEANENSQLKKGIIGSSGISSLNFVGNSVKDGNFFSLTELGDGSIILKNGKCSGSITGYGKINPTLSNYSFASCDKRENLDDGPYPLNDRELPWDYEMSGKGKVSINNIDYFEFSIIRAIYSPANYKAGDPGLQVGETEFRGALFSCPITYDGVVQGEATITLGAGKFKTFAGRKLEVYRNGGTKGINRVTGEMYLIFTIK
jgi:hypothetical protein